MNAGPWLSAAAFEKWWRDNVREFNLLAVVDPEEWERIATVIDRFQTKRYLDS